VRFTLRSLFALVTIVCLICGAVVAFVWPREHCEQIYRLPLGTKGTLVVFARDSELAGYFKGCFSLYEGSKPLIEKQGFGHVFSNRNQPKDYYSIARNGDVLALLQPSGRLSIDEPLPAERPAMVGAVISTYSVLFVDVANLDVCPGNMPREHFTRILSAMPSSWTIEPNIDVLSWIKLAALDGAAVTPESIRALSQIPNLESIELADANIGVSEAAALMDLDHVEYLDLQCACVSNDAVLKLLQKLPPSFVRLTLNISDRPSTAVEKTANGRAYYVYSERDCPPISKP
jgi:hypothetical protein